MAEFDFSTFPTLTTPRLILREIIPGDAADLFSYASDPEVQKYDSDPPMREITRSDFTDRADRSMVHLRQGDQLGHCFQGREPFDRGSGLLLLGKGLLQGRIGIYRGPPVLAARHRGRGRPRL